MDKKTFSIVIIAFLVHVYVSGALVSGSFNLQAASAAEFSPAENPGAFQAEAAREGGFSKDALNPAQKKLSTDLLQLSDERYLPPGNTYEALKARMEKAGQLRPADAFAGPLANSEGSEVNSFQGAAQKVNVYVYLEASASSRVLDRYCEVSNRDEENKITAAWVPLDSLETLASLPQVKSVRTVMPPVTRNGSVSTEGDLVHRASEVRDRYGVTGEGIKIGIISDGVDSLASARASGDLPPDVHVLRNAVGGDEGTAMLEIVHDLAPGAELYFHDCGRDKLEFNAGIDALVEAGCTVVCDDIGWLAEPFFEDGVVASHVAEVIRDQDILYVSSAGNAAGRHYQGLFYDSGSGWHDFSGGAGTGNGLSLSIPPGKGFLLVLEWADPWGYSANDYDIYLVDDATSDILEFSSYEQNGDDWPIEYISYSNNGSDTVEASIRIHRYSGEAKELELYIYPSYGVFIMPDYLVAEDSIFGHPAVPEAVAVGAIDARDPGNDDIEYFSSRGPVTIAYPTPETRLKTDISGIDGVSITGAGGFPNPFYGTSAAAPHVAAVSGLVWSAFPEKSSMDIKRLLYTSAVDLGDPGHDTVFGHGRADALLMYEKAAAEPRAFSVNASGGGDFVSLSDAINASKPGDSILIYPGTYRENVNVPWALAISSVSGNQEDTVIEAADPGEPVFHVTANAVNISGFGIKGAASAYGLYLDSVQGCTLGNNTVQDNYFGVWLEDSGNNTLLNNRISGNTYNFGVNGSYGNLQNSIGQDNSVGGKPVYYLINASDKAPEFFEGAGTVYCIDCRNVSLRDLDLKNNLFGAYFYNTSGSSLENSSISGNGLGIYLLNSGSNTLGNNSVIDNEEGLRLTGSFQNRIHRNEFENTANINEEGTDSTHFNLWNSTGPVSYLYGGNIYSSYFGNFYSDYSGPDGDSNGIGDSSYGSDSYPLLALPGAYITSFAIGNLVPAEDPGSIEGDVLEFGLRATVPCNVSWWVNGSRIQDNVSISAAAFQVNTSGLLASVPDSTPETPFTAEYNISAFAENGSETLRKSWNLTVFLTEEDNSIIAGVIVPAPSNVSENESVSFDFTEGESSGSGLGDSSVYNVSFYSLENLGNVSAKLELLDEKPSGTEGSPSGDVVYRYLNIEFDSPDVPDSASLLNRTIAFRILKSWASENDINTATITMQRYHNGSWALLDVTKEGEAGDYLYFRAETPGFSSFAVTASQNTHDRSGSGSSGSSSGGGGGGGGSPEPAGNVESKELAQRFVTNGNHARFDFTRKATPVDYVEFDPKKSAGKTTTIVEMLKDRSVLVSGLPDGEVYRHLNIWVGNSGFATPENIGNPLVGFRVETAWVFANGVDEATISLCRYEDESWTRLSTQQTGKDPDYLYFEAETPGFSSFSIVGQKNASLSRPLSGEPEGPGNGSKPELEDVPGFWTTRSEGEEDEGVEEDADGRKSAPGAGIFTGATLLLASAVFLRKR